MSLTPRDNVITEDENDVDVFLLLMSMDILINAIADVPDIQERLQAAKLEFEKAQTHLDPYLQDCIDRAYQAILSQPIFQEN
ncbi:hypothetical protein ACEYX6_00845 [Acinetobacter sp. c2-A9]|uniref:hypothetical protein n=1 Tax=Acinetobacter sp. c2-A9 TaxID=3342802 RepID=UPI0035B6FC36